MKKIMTLAITTIMVSSVPMTAMAAECNIKDKLSSLTKTNSTYSLKDLCADGKGDIESLINKSLNDCKNAVKSLNNCKTAVKAK